MSTKNEEEIINIEDFNDFPNVYRYCRDLSKISHELLADWSKVSKSKLESWYKGRVNQPDLVELLKVAEVMPRVDAKATEVMLRCAKYPVTLDDLYVSSKDADLQSIITNIKAKPAMAPAASPIHVKQPSEIGESKLAKKKSAKEGEKSEETIVTENAPKDPLHVNTVPPIEPVKGNELTTADSEELPTTGENSTENTPDQPDAKLNSPESLPDPLITSIPDKTLASKDDTQRELLPVDINSESSTPVDGDEPPVTVSEEISTTREDGASRSPDQNPADPTQSTRKAVSSLPTKKLAIALASVGLLVTLVIGLIYNLPKASPTLTPDLTSMSAQDATATERLVSQSLTPTQSTTSIAAEATLRTINIGSILIIKFHNVAFEDPKIQEALSDALKERAIELGLQHISVIVDPTEFSVDELEQAKALGRRYAAGMVIWGDSTNTRVTVNVVDLAETTLSGTYIRLITGDFSSQINFFSSYIIGRVYADGGYYSNGIELIEEGVTSLASQAEPLGMEYIYDYLAGLYLASTPKNSDKAIQNYTKSITINPNFGDSYFYRGLLLKLQKRLDEAIVDFDEVIRLNPENALAFYLRGDINFSQEKLENALTDVQKALKIDPDFAAAYVLLGKIQDHQKQYDNAVANFSKAIDLAPENYSGFYLRALSYQSLEKYDLATVDLTKALELAPSDSDVLEARMFLYSAIGRQREAYADIQRLLQMNPERSEQIYSEYNLGLAICSSKQLLEADTGVAYDCQSLLPK